MNNNFLYSCIGDNSPENREHLEKIGAKLAEGMSIDAKYLYAYIAFSGEYCYYSHNDRQAPLHVVNCISNDPLFQAVTAMRDDSDYMQWFKTDFENKLIPDVKEMYLCKSREFCGITVKYKGEDFVIGSAGFHKATLAELKEHFK